MKFVFIPLLVGGVIASNIQGLYAQDAKATGLLNASIEAMGGRALLNGLKSMRYTARGHELMLEQSERPEGPYMVSYFTLQVEKELTRPRGVFAINYTANTRPYQILVDGERVGAIVGKNVFPMYPETEEQIALAPEKVVFTALASNPRYIKDTVIQGSNHHIVNFLWKQAPVRLFINQYTKLPAGIELIRYYVSNFNYVWGDTKRATLFSFWHLEKNGLHYPYQSDVFVNGRLFRTTTIDSVQFDVPLASASLSISDSSYAQMQMMKRMIDPLEKPKLTPGEIAAGIYFIPGNWNTAFVNTNEGIYVLEAPVSSVYSKAVLEQISQVFPSQKIAGVISTSNAWPHIGGLRTYVDRKLPIYLLDQNSDIVKDIVFAKHTIFPDELSARPTRPVLRTISSGTRVGTGDNRMEIYPMRTESGERMMLVYFPQKRLLYTSDMVQPSRGGFFMKQYLSEVRDVVDREGLRVENIFGMHLPVTPYQKVLDALK